MSSSRFRLSGQVSLMTQSFSSMSEAYSRREHPSAMSATGQLLTMTVDSPFADLARSSADISASCACGMALGFQFCLKSGTRFTKFEIAGHEIEAMAHGLVELLFAYFYHFREIAGLHVEQR